MNEREQERFQWTFDENEPGRIEGLLHPGIAFFRGHPFRSLAREMIQNSLDAADDSGRPVKVSFTLRTDIEFGGCQLRETFDRCLDALEGKEGDDYSFINMGFSALVRRKPLPCLIVADYNTVGLAGPRLDYLVKGDAASWKGKEGGLGNRGIGKAAAFAVSILNTVLYSSQFVEPGTGRMRRAFQGKASLVSHTDQAGDRRGRTGYYGINEWDPLKEFADETSDIPENVRRSEVGTNIVIIGFASTPDWEVELVKSVIMNFYYAVMSSRLEVEVIDASEKRWAVDNTTLGSLFQRLCASSHVDDPIHSSHELFKCIVDPTDPTKLTEPTQRGQLNHLGHCMAWIRVDDGLPRSAEIVRMPGMVICDGVRRLPSIKNLRRHWSDFAAVVVCEDPKGNDLLKRMEPPDHNDFRPAYLNDKERRRGEQALAELGGKIRDWLDYMMPQPESDDEQEIDELARFFPSDDPESGGGGDEIDPFGDVLVGGIKERLPVLRQPDFTTIGRGTREDDEDDFGSGDGPVDDPSGGGATEDGTGTTQVRQRREFVRIQDVRFVQRGEKQLNVWFTPQATTMASLNVRVGSEERSKVDVVAVEGVQDLNGNPLTQGEIRLTTGERAGFAVFTKQPFPADRALVIDVTTEVIESQ